MLGVPATTEFDLKFRLLGIPVRVHPLFWVLAAFLGWSNRHFGEILVWIGCVFVSILVHEFGHGLTARALIRRNPFVVLYMMGGLCVYDQDDRRPWRRVGILLMGPGAGFLLLIATAIVGTLLTGVTPLGTQVHDVPTWVTPLVWEGYSDLILINLVWGIFNLLPIFPLDGGQIVQTLLLMRNRREGARWSYIVSIGMAALLAVYLYQRGQSINALLIAYLGLINFQLLQAARFQGQYDNRFEDDDNWWRK